MATSNLDVSAEVKKYLQLNSSEIEAKLLENWWRVVVFYSLRLSFAPVIETVLLLDRAVYLFENGCDKTMLLPIFEPAKSPRNHVLLALKK